MSYREWNGRGLTHWEWKDAFDGFGGEAGAKLKEMMYADWTRDRKEQYRAGVEAMRDAIQRHPRYPDHDVADEVAARLLEEKP